jgi:hypothetical protein
MTDRTEQANTRLTEKEKAKLKRAARRAGLPFSEWLRLAGLAAAGVCPLCGTTLTKHSDD